MSARKEKVAAAVAAVKAGTPPLEAAADAGIGKDVLYRALKREENAAIAASIAKRSTAPAGAAVEAPVLPPEMPATPKDRQIDELVAKSRTWQRVAVALARALAGHPQAAADVAKALREVRL